MHRLANDLKDYQFKNCDDAIQLADELAERENKTFIVYIPGFEAGIYEVHSDDILKYIPDEYIIYNSNDKLKEE